MNRDIQQRTVDTHLPSGDTRPVNLKNTSTPELSLRHLKAMMHVAKHQNLTRAANILNRSQTAITKAISDLESQLHVKLFDRSSTGMQPTVYGAALAKRAEQAEAEFNAAGAAYTEYKKDARSYQNIAIFSMDISYKRLASYIVLHDTGNFSAAANQLGITRTAIYSSVRQLEELLELPLFERKPRGVAATAFGAVLIQHIKLAFAQIRHALDDIDSLNGVINGIVTVGTLPYTRTILTPRAINHLLEIQPQLDVSTAEGPYALLEASLRCGDLDFIVGAIRPEKNSTDLITETLFEDRLSVIVRQGHPLQSKKNCHSPTSIHTVGCFRPAIRQLGSSLIRSFRITACLLRNTLSKPALYQPCVDCYWRAIDWHCSQSTKFTTTRNMAC